MSFYDTVIRNSKSFRSDAVCKDANLLEPGTRKAVQALMDDAKQQGHDLRLLETYRSQTRQSALFSQRRTQLRTVGCHGYGVAVDFGVFVNGKYAEQNGPYVFLRTLARKHGLVSGQDWGRAKMGSFVDSGHVQRIPVWRQNALFAGAWYPPETGYDPYTDSVMNHHSDVVGALPTVALGAYFFSQIPFEGPFVYDHGMLWWALLVLGYAAFCSVRRLGRQSYAPQI